MLYTVFNIISVISLIHVLLVIFKQELGYEMCLDQGRSIMTAETGVWTQDARFKTSYANFSVIADSWLVIQFLKSI